MDDGDEFKELREAYAKIAELERERDEALREVDMLRARLNCVECNDAARAKAQLADARAALLAFADSCRCDDPCFCGRRKIALVARAAIAKIDGGK